MPRLEISSPRPDVQRHVEVALSLAPTVKPPLPLLAAAPAAPPVPPGRLTETTIDWLDTPPVHCSPLDDY
jgi:hypothetical protein